MVLEGVVIAPRWSVASVPAVGVVVQLFVLELLGQTEAVFHLVFGVLVEGARAVEDLLVLLVVVALGVRLINGSDKVVWLAAAILTRLGSFWPITATAPMMTAVVIAAVAVAPVVGAIVAAMSWAMSVRILVEAHLGFLGISILVDGCDHLANPSRWLVVELRAKLAVVESSDEGGDDLSFRDVGDRVPHLRKASYVAAEELRRLLVDAV